MLQLQTDHMNGYADFEECKFPISYFSCLCCFYNVLYFGYFSFIFVDRSDLMPQSKMC